MGGVLTSTDLSVLPPKLLTRLEEATNASDIKMIDKEKANDTKHPGCR